MSHVVAYRGDVARVKVRRLLEEGQACVRVHHVLDGESTGVSLGVYRHVCLASTTHPSEREDSSATCCADNNEETQARTHFWSFFFTETSGWQRARGVVFFERRVHVTIGAGVEGPACSDIRSRRCPSASLRRDMCFIHEAVSSQMAPGFAGTGQFKCSFEGTEHWADRLWDEIKADGTAGEKTLAGDGSEPSLPSCHQATGPRCLSAQLELHYCHEPPPSPPTRVFFSSVFYP